MSKSHGVGELVSKTADMLSNFYVCLGSLIILFRLNYKNIRFLIQINWWDKWAAEDKFNNSQWQCFVWWWTVSTVNQWMITKYLVKKKVSYLEYTHAYNRTLLSLYSHSNFLVTQRLDHTITLTLPSLKNGLATIKLPNENTVIMRTNSIAQFRRSEAWTKNANRTYGRQFL